MDKFVMLKKVLFRIALVICLTTFAFTLAVIILKSFPFNYLYINIGLFSISLIIIVTILIIDAKNKNEATIKKPSKLQNALLIGLPIFIFILLIPYLLFPIYGITDEDDSYHVFYVQEDVNGDYNIVEEECFDGKLTEKTKVEYREYDGYTFSSESRVYAKKESDISFVEIVYDRHKFNLNISTDDVLKGTVDTSLIKEYCFGAKIRLNASANEGYKFKGWYQNGTLVSTDINYEFFMPRYNVYYVAIFE